MDIQRRRLFRVENFEDRKTLVPAKQGASESSPLTSLESVSEPERDPNPFPQVSVSLAEQIGS